MRPAIAVVGSGPSGLYCAEKLARDLPGAAIDVVERWPVPFGLVRSGVAPDHQVTKAVTRVIERPLSSGRVGFFGNVELGRDLSLDELAGLYDAVVLATGAEGERRLGIPGEDLPGSLGAGAFVAWANCRPDAADLSDRIARARNVVIVGNGNVALDVARLFAKGADEFAGSDLHPDVAAALGAAALERISVVGRRGAEWAAFTPVELGEFERLARTRPIVDPAALPPDAGDESPVLATLRRFASAPPDERKVPAYFSFGLRPLRFEGGANLEAAVFADANGEEVRLPADLAVSCIGWRAEFPGLLTPEGRIPNTDGSVRPALYVVGWAGRGASGTIATNRAEAHRVAARVGAELAPGNRPGTEGLEALLRARGVDIVRWPRWKAIDAAEIAAAGEGRVRRKFRTRTALLGVPAA